MRAITDTSPDARMSTEKIRAMITMSRILRVDAAEVISGSVARIPTVIRELGATRIYEGRLHERKSSAGRIGVPVAGTVLPLEVNGTVREEQKAKEHHELLQVPGLSWCLAAQ